MNEKAIRKLKRKFIYSSMLALGTAMILMAGMIYFSNVGVNQNVIHMVLTYIADHDGEIPSVEEQHEEQQEAREQALEGNESIDYSLVRYLNEIIGSEENIRVDSPEFRYQTRYFSVVFEDGEVSKVNVNQIAAVTTRTAVELANRVMTRKKNFARIGTFYYLVDRQEDGEIVVVFLDATTQLYANSRLMYSALMLIGIGVLIAFVLLVIFSTRAIRPEIENVVTQKRFITNASHELKTPLAVIRANAEMQEMIAGENEWTQSTLRQVERLNGLIQNLVLITRAQEKEEGEERIDTDVSAIVKDTFESYLPVAERDGKKMISEISEDIHLQANDSQIRQLITLLLDNAIKYCDDKGSIRTTLAQKGRGIVLTVSNTYAEGRNVDYSRFFERFYRAEEHHNIDQGGYGIGLSIAESLVEQYDGSITANWKNDVISFVCVLK